MADFTRESFPSPEARCPLVPVEVMGGTLYVRAMSVMAAAKLPDDDSEKFVSGMLLQSVRFGDGSAVWATEEEALAYPMEDLRPLIQAALKVNHLNGAAVEDATKN